MTQFKYVEMVCNLDQNTYDDSIQVKDMVIEPINNTELHILFECYTQAFGSGDAEFFKHQNKEEQKRFFEEKLGFPDVLNNPASFTYKINDKVIGFALVLPYLENNYHISCMCILPEYQNRGLGKAMLNRIKNIAQDNGCKSLTLGTETEMKAYHLYKNHGFTITEEHLIEI